MSKQITFKVTEDLEISSSLTFRPLDYSITLVLDEDCNYRYLDEHDGSFIIFCDGMDDRVVTIKDLKELTNQELAHLENGFEVFANEYLLVELDNQGYLECFRDDHIDDMDEEIKHLRYLNRFYGRS